MESEKRDTPVSANTICLALLSSSCSSTSDKPTREVNYCWSFLSLPGLAGQHPKVSRASLLSIKTLAAIFCHCKFSEIFFPLVYVKLYVRILNTISEKM